MHEPTQNRIPAADADRLIAAHDGDVALLYVWLSQRGALDVNRAANELCRTAAEISSAAEKLGRMGLFAETPAPRGETAAPELPDELPEYNAEDIVRRSTEDRAFQGILCEAKRILNKTSLTRPDMNILFGIYDYLSLPPEVICTLMQYCADLFAEKYGTERRPSMRSIEQEAYSWARKEIFTLEQADGHIKREKQRRSEISLIASDLGIRGRSLSATEQKYLSSWMDMGFGRDELAVAYDRTVTNTGSLKWGYMNRIVQSWHEKGLHTVRDIEEKDPRSGARARPGRAQNAVSREEYERLQAIYEKVRNG